jgi:hypothetical protein
LYEPKDDAVVGATIEFICSHVGISFQASDKIGYCHLQERHATTVHCENHKLSILMLPSGRIID